MLAINNLSGLQVEENNRYWSSTATGWPSQTEEHSEISFGETTVAEGLKGQDVMERDVHPDDGVLRFTAKNPRYMILDPHDIVLGGFSS